MCGGSQLPGSMARGVHGAVSACCCAVFVCVTVLAHFLVPKGMRNFVVGIATAMVRHSTVQLLQAVGARSALFDSPSSCTMLHNTSSCCNYASGTHHTLCRLTATARTYVLRQHTPPPPHLTDSISTA